MKDLPKSTLGVDIDNDFDTEYIVIPGKEKVLVKLKKLAESADNIYLAPDPDREGEAIAAHLAEELGDNGSKEKRRRKGKDETAFASGALPSTKSRSERCAKHSSIRAILTGIWSTRSRPAAYSIALSDIRFHRCCGTKFAVVFPPDVCRP